MPLPTAEGDEKVDVFPQNRWVSTSRLRCFPTKSLGVHVSTAHKIERMSSRTSLCGAFVAGSTCCICRCRLPRVTKNSTLSHKIVGCPPLDSVGCPRLDCRYLSPRIGCPPLDSLSTFSTPVGCPLLGSRLLEPTSLGISAPSAPSAGLKLLRARVIHLHCAQAPSRDLRVMFGPLAHGTGCSPLSTLAPVVPRPRPSQRVR